MKTKLDRAAIQKKYSAQNSMFKICNEPAQGESDFHFIRRYAVILWCAIAVLYLIIGI